MMSSRWLLMFGALVMALGACSSGADEEELIFTSSVLREAGRGMCDRGTFTCSAELDGLTDEQRDLLREPGHGPSDILCENAPSDFQRPSIDLTPIAGTWSNLSGVASDTVCTASFGSHLFESSDGEPAVLRPADLVFYNTSRPLREVTCGDRVTPNPDFLFVTTPVEGDSGEVLILADGGRVEMTTTVEIVLGRFDCVESHGVWVGVGGALDGETGTYSWLTEQVQERITLRRD